MTRAQRRDARLDRKVARLIRQHTAAMARLEAGQIRARGRA